MYVRPVSIVHKAGVSLPTLHPKIQWMYPELRFWKIARSYSFLGSQCPNTKKSLNQVLEPLLACLLIYNCFMFSICPKSTEQLLCTCALEVLFIGHSISKNSIHSNYRTSYTKLTTKNEYHNTLYIHLSWCSHKMQMPTEHKQGTIYMYILTLFLYGQLEKCWNWVFYPQK